MNKAQLVQAIKMQNSFPHSQAAKIVNVFFKSISDALARGQRVEIRGLGSIEVKQYKPYTGRNPRTGKRVQVKAKRLPFFKCGKELKERVNA